MKQLIAGLALTLATTFSYGANYVIDTNGAHASINFKIQHLGYSWLKGRFNNFSGEFSYDPANPQASEITVNIDTTSLDSNHAERDKHLRSDDFLSVEKFPKSSFKSTRFELLANDEMRVFGDLTLHGVTKPIVIDVEKIGEGQDPWGGYRAGFAGKTILTLADYGITYNLGPASANVELELHVEGIRQ